MNPKDAAEWAIKHAAALPNEYKAAAFQEFLRFQLGNDIEGAGNTGALPAKKAAKSVSEMKPISWVAEILEGLPPDHVIREKGSEAQQVGWAVICLAADGQSAINKTIGQYIRLRLSIAPPSRQNINRALRKLVPRYLSRDKSEKGKGLTYLPKPSIVALFSDLKTNEA